MKSLAIDEFIAESGSATILDTRTTEEFKNGFIPESIHVPLKEAFAEWANSVLDNSEPLILVTNPEEEEKNYKLLTDAGFKSVTGYLLGGFDAWRQAGKAIDMIIDVEPYELLMDIPFDEKMAIIDVRKPMEFAEGHLKQAMNMPLKEINDPVKIAQVEEDDNLYLYCGGGTRSVIAASVLKKHGVHNLHNVEGGWKKIKEQPKAEIVKEPEILN